MGKHNENSDKFACKFMAKTNNINYEHSYKHASWRAISRKDSSTAPQWKHQDLPHTAEVTCYLTLLIHDFTHTHTHNSSVSCSFSFLTS